MIFLAPYMERFYIFGDFGHASDLPNLIVSDASSTNKKVTRNVGGSMEIPKVPRSIESMLATYPIERFRKTAPISKYFTYFLFTANRSNFLFYSYLLIKFYKFHMGRGRGAWLRAAVVFQIVPLLPLGRFRERERESVCVCVRGPFPTLPHGSIGEIWKNTATRSPF